MTQEEKQILLKDLCARVPYGVIYHRNDGANIELREVDIKNGTLNYTDNIVVRDCKPYLRSMSSMTKEEIEECSQLQEDTIHVRFYKYDEGYEKTIDLPYFEILVDFFNSHHLDFRGLIPMGLALEAPEGMYV